MEAGIRVQFGAEVVGKLDGVRESWYVIAAQRRIQHPAVAALLEQARLA